HNGGKTEEEDSKPIEWEEDTLPDGESGHNGGKTEEEDSKPIEWEEDTLPDGESGHNGGKTEEEDTKPIDDEKKPDEDTTPDNNKKPDEDKTPDDNKKPDEDKTPDESKKPDEGNNNNVPIDNNGVIIPNGNSVHTKDIKKENISYQKISNNTKVKMSNSSLQSGVKSKQQMKQAKVEQVNELPATGEKSQSTTLFATLLALIGTTLLFKRKRKNAK
ncbi:LPXTG cell wall anchor domain-containing protein, partial [Staphylococcus caeli]|uniref:LPXTG cell wall anchor domain-containing protein n=1 Tax=Staphylococcus caeli TaxID=2201815 RepID=UPI003F564AEE